MVWCRFDGFKPWPALFWGGGEGRGKRVVWLKEGTWARLGISVADVVYSFCRGPDLVRVDLNSELDMIIVMRLMRAHDGTAMRAPSSGQQ